MDHPIAVPLDPATPLRRLIALAVPICRRGELDLPPRGPGRPVEFPEWALAVPALVAVAKRLTTKSAQYRYLATHAADLVGRLGLGRFPARSTYFARHIARGLPRDERRRGGPHRPPPPAAGTSTSAARPPTRP